MAHRFLHTLVFSSVMALEGCSSSHHLPMEPPDGGMPDAPGMDASQVDASIQRDAGPPPFDGGSPNADAGAPPFDGGSPRQDAGNEPRRDAGPDAEPPLDPRFCEPGWQTTKASTCEPLDVDDPESPFICYNRIVCEETENDMGELVSECRDWEESDGGCLLPRAE